MSPLGKTTQKKKTNPLVFLKPYILPAYIIFSALFILYVLVGYVKISVYQAGIQHGYNTVYTEIVSTASKPEACQGLTVSASEGQSVVLVNVDCLQKEEDDGSLNPEDDPATFLHLQR